MAIGPADTLEEIELSPGLYNLLVEGLADNCEVRGGNPQGLRITAGETTAITLEVACSPTQGQLRSP